MSEPTGAKRNSHPLHCHWLSSILRCNSLHIRQAIHGATSTLFMIIGFVVLAIAFMRVRPETTGVLLRGNACYDIPSFPYQAPGWPMALPDLGDLLRLQNELNEITKDAPSYMQLRQRIFKLSQAVVLLYLDETTPDLPLQDRADLKGVGYHLSRLFYAIVGLEFAAKRAVDTMQIENEDAALELASLPSSPHRNLILKALDDIYAVIMPGHAERYKQSLSEGWSKTRTCLLSGLDMSIRDGIDVVDLAGYLAEVVARVQQSIEKEKTRREDMNASRTKLVGWLASVLPSVVYRKIQQLVLSADSISLDGITDLSPLLLESLARVSQLVRQLKMIRLEAEELGMKHVTMRSCADIASHVEAQRGLLETAQKASHAVSELFELEDRKDRDRLQKIIDRIRDRQSQAKEENLDR